jgi:hypothetical protein
MEKKFQSLCNSMGFFFAVVFERLILSQQPSQTATDMLKLLFSVCVLCSQAHALHKEGRRQDGV